MRLPGGLLREGELRRQFRFREPDGALELSILEGARRREPLPRQVSRVLVAALEHLGGEPPELAKVEELCIADRQFLMRRLRTWLGDEQPWHTVRCTGCQERFDFELNVAELPVKEAGAGFPFVEVETGQGRVRGRVPTGADQLALAERVTADVRALLERCLFPADVARLEEGDIALIEEALEAVSPGVVTRVGATCPGCGATQVVTLEPYSCLFMESTLLEEVHTLASAYHWSERDILALPLHRRRQYLRLVERATGQVA
ncbi:hypothetical protein CYFUS_004463 [Cystobacter fuscus]|uniref:T4 bacteriophage base plate protein n=1 Tax=Cystobacter fuscus TaxID=43 RepID=A0A250J516_9BACT|nr:hypothetical protein [Cystobacter fuscus]ATB39024.1 hypothetical protein CYFUS_004463 [Cystobacter fuscus]